MQIAKRPSSCCIKVSILGPMRLCFPRLTPAWRRHRSKFRPPGETVVLHGGVRLGPEVLQPFHDPAVLARVPAEARTNVWFINLRALGITDYGQLQQHGFGTPVGPAEMELFVDGQPWHLARYPNVGILKIGRIIDKGSVPRYGDKSRRGATFGYEYERASR